MGTTKKERAYRNWYVVVYRDGTEHGQPHFASADVLANTEKEAGELAQEVIEMTWGIQQVHKQGTAEDYDRLVEMAYDVEDFELDDVVELVNTPE